MNASRLIRRTNTGLVKRRPGKWSLKRYVGVRRQDAECGAGKGLLSEGLARLIGTSDRMRMAQEQLLSPQPGAVHTLTVTQAVSSLTCDFGSPTFSIAAVEPIWHTCSAPFDRYLT